MSGPSSGPQPARARSALTLRMVLASFGLLVSCAAALIFALEGVPSVWTVIAVVLAGVAAVDLVVIIRRKLHGEPG